MKKEVSNKELDEKASTQIETQEQEPRLYQVMLHNDDFTPMEFVVSILEKFFFMDRRMANDVMLKAHMDGRAVCGIFSKDFAESKVVQVIEYAQTYDHPLLCSTESE